MHSDCKASNRRLIAEARDAVLEQNKKSEFDSAPYERATQLLESLPAAEFADEKVQLALDVTSATRVEYRPDLSRRALYAAFPAESEIRDLRLRRKWFTFAALIEAHWGNVERAFKYKLVALDLCHQLNDSFGYCVEWTNFASLVSGAGLYEDAIRYATVAIEAEGESSASWLDMHCGALICRANALMRLGRFAEAEADLLLSLMAITHSPIAPVRTRMVIAQYLFAEVRLERGDITAARRALGAASTWASACDVPRYKLEVDRVGALLLAFEHQTEQAISSLTGLLARAHDLEATFGATANEDVVLDVLHTLERVHRASGYVVGANRWLEAIGQKLRQNATKVIDALVDKPLLADRGDVSAKTTEIDNYLRSRATAKLGLFETTKPSWAYLIGLAASAIALEDATKEHGVRVARLASFVAHELGLADAVRRGIELGCLVHDVGKVSIPALILSKQTALDTSELRLYDAHPVVGAELLERVTHPEHAIVRNVVQFHHCHYADDSAQSLPVGQALPLEARIASVCDEYDSLVSGRPRCPAISSNDALREIFHQRSEKFDPKIVDVFVEVVRRLQRTHSDIQAYLSEEADSIEYFAMQRTLKRAAERALVTQ